VITSIETREYRYPLDPRVVVEQAGEQGFAQGECGRQSLCGAFSLTPALSLRERGNRFPRLA
jgi:hypothetical protein